MKSLKRLLGEADPFIIGVAVMVSSLPLTLAGTALHDNGIFPSHPVIWAFVPLVTMGTLITGFMITHPTNAVVVERLQCRLDPEDDDE